ncbi:MAG: ABC transporter substrate-binding protein [Roseiflexus sp.]|nr:ABC transporter substrate-binding protein [Roseiflexus sp.]MDW8327790.1 ABC transporter substrate-binding protein [Anaerolineales bacterium]
MWTRPILSFSLGIALALAACTGVTPTPTRAPLTPVKLMLDWVPNTNHTGFFVAQEKGYFTEAGLQVEIIQPGEVLAEQAVTGGAADFGVSFQEQITLARGDERAPLVSLAAIIQSNTSGFASRAEQGADSPADWGGLRYGSYGTPFEAPTLIALMECAGGDFSQLQVINTGFSDPLALLSEKQIDLAWIFYGWQGIQAEQQGIALNIEMMSEWFDCIPDYYTPILITSERTIKERPEVVRAFVGAVSRGYTFAIENPDEAASILLRAAPELDEKLVRASQAWLSPRYKGNAPRWGEQKLSVWENYSKWLAENGVLNEPIDAQAAFTNEFLP